MSSIRDFYCHRYQLNRAAQPDSEPTFHRRVEAALRRLGDAPRRILDFGCNIGSASRLFLEAGHELVGVDISESAIDAARQLVPGGQFLCIDSEARLPFADASFDACFSSEVIEHLFDVRGNIREVRRLLRPGGLFLLTTPYHGWIKNLLVVTFNFEGHFAASGGHIRFFSRKSLERCLRAEGFRVECFRGIGRFWPVWKSMFVAARKVS